jgi:hypothetical protein
VSGNGDVLNGPNSFTVQVDPIKDIIPPVLTGVPADTTVSCDAVPSVPTVTAKDNCDGSVDVTETEKRTDGPCPNTYTLVRTWTASDHANPPNTVTASQTINVQDTTPPSLDPSNTALDTCLWPPNHKYYYFTDLSVFNTKVVDNCPGPVKVTFVSCTSSQPDNTQGHNRRLLQLATGGNQGDGQTTQDCVFEGGILKVRAERAGQNSSPRVYTLTLKYTDECGNALTTNNNHISVPHDIKDVPGPCLTANN